MITTSSRADFGFKTQILLSNNNPLSTPDSEGKQYIYFVNYDFKNEIESFSKKENNPLHFPKQLFIEVEEEIDLENINFEEIEYSPQNINIKATVTKEEYIAKVERH